MILITNILLLLCVGGFAKKCKPGDNIQDEPLLLTPLVDNGETNKARNLSAVDPTLFAGFDSHAGFFNVNKTNNWNMFFWYFPAKGLPLESTPWVIYLEGGPGLSSLYSMFEHIGPIQIVNGKAKKMPITWGSDYSLVFIDNPVGTGFSYTDAQKYATNEDEVGAALLSFIQQFLQVFPELRQAPLFLAGESYAGKFIPAFGHYIHNRNDSLSINFKGLAISGPWIDPPTILHYTELSLQLGLIDPEQAHPLKKLEEEARKAWDEGDLSTYIAKAGQCFTTLFDIIQVNAYDYLKDGANDDVIPSSLPQFLNRSDVRNAIHVGNVPYIVYNDDVRVALDGENFLTVKPWVEELLEHYGVLCYNGQLDMTVPYAPSVHTYRSFKWSGAQEYLRAERQKILIDDKVIGYSKGAGNFREVMVRNAGHLVSLDQPRAAKHIVDLFIEDFKK